MTLTTKMSYNFVLIADKIILITTLFDLTPHLNNAFVVIFQNSVRITKHNGSVGKALIRLGIEGLLVQTHWSHCVVSLSKTLIRCLVLPVHPRKSC